MPLFNKIKDLLILWAIPFHENVQFVLVTVSCSNYSNHYFNQILQLIWAINICLLVERPLLKEYIIKVLTPTTILYTLDVEVVLMGHFMSESVGNSMAAIGKLCYFYGFFYENNIGC